MPLKIFLNVLICCVDALSWCVVVCHLCHFCNTILTSESIALCRVICFSLQRFGKFRRAPTRLKDERRFNHSSSSTGGGASPPKKSPLPSAGGKRARIICLREGWDVCLGELATNTQAGRLVESGAAEVKRARIGFGTRDRVISTTEFRESTFDITAVTFFLPYRWYLVLDPSPSVRGQVLQRVAVQLLFP